MGINKEQFEIEMAKHMLTSNDLVKAGMGLLLQISDYEIECKMVEKAAEEFGGIRKYDTR